MTVADTLRRCKGMIVPKTRPRARWKLWYHAQHVEVRLVLKVQRHSAELNFEVGLEATRGARTLAKLSREIGLHPGQISEWKRQPHPPVPLRSPQSWGDRGARLLQKTGEPRKHQ